LVARSAPHHSHILQEASRHSHILQEASRTIHIFNKQRRTPLAYTANGCGRHNLVILKNFNFQQVAAAAIN